MTVNRARAGAGAVLTAVVLSALTSACGGKPATAPVVCPSPGSSIIRTVDGSPSAMTPQYTKTIEAQFDAAISQAAFCPDVEAHLVQFASSAGDSRVLYSGTPVAEGQNKRARTHKLKVSVVPQLTRQVHDQFEHAAPALGPGSDPLAAFDLLHDYSATHPNRALDAVITTDGISTSSRLPLDHPLTAEDMAKAASVAVATVNVSKLTVMGIGATAAPFPPADYVTALRSFWATVCTRVAPACVVSSEVAK